MNAQSLWTDWVCVYDCVIVMNRLSVRLWMRDRYEQTECAFMNAHSLWTDCAFMNVQSLWTYRVCVYDCAIVMNRHSVLLWMRHRYEQTECTFMNVQSLWTDWVCFYDCAIVMNRLSVRLWMRHRYEQTECAFMTVQSLWTDIMCVYELFDCFYLIT